MHIEQSLVAWVGNTTFQTLFKIIVPFLLLFQNTVFMPQLFKQGLFFFFLLLQWAVQRNVKSHSL